MGPSENHPIDDELKSEDYEVSNLAMDLHNTFEKLADSPLQKEDHIDDEVKDKRIINIKENYGRQSYLFGEETAMTAEIDVEEAGRRKIYQENDEQKAGKKETKEENQNASEDGDTSEDEHSKEIDGDNNEVNTTWENIQSIYQIESGSITEFSKAPKNETSDTMEIHKLNADSRNFSGKIDAQFQKLEQAAIQLELPLEGD